MLSIHNCFKFFLAHLCYHERGLSAKHEQTSPARQACPLSNKANQYACLSEDVHRHVHDLKNTLTPLDVYYLTGLSKWFTNFTTARQIGGDFDCGGKINRIDLSYLL